MIDERIFNKGGTLQTAAPPADSAETQRELLPPDARRKADQRRRAKRIMIIVTLVCVGLGLGPTAEQLVRHGWHSFVDRAPGVGGTPAAPDNGPAQVGEAPAAPPQKPQRGTKKSAAAIRPDPSAPVGSSGSPRMILNARPVAAVKPARGTCTHTTTRISGTGSSQTFRTSFRSR